MQSTKVAGVQDYARRRHLLYYAKSGAALISLVDVDGADRSDFHPEPTPGIAKGSSGWFRGVDFGPEPETVTAAGRIARP